MSEASRMHEELEYWKMLIQQMQAMAIEMESHEQDKEYIDKSILDLFLRIGEYEPDEDGINDQYAIDFQHPHDPTRKLVFVFKAYLQEDEHE